MDSNTSPVSDIMFYPLERPIVKHVLYEEPLQELRRGLGFALI